MGKSRRRPSPRPETNSPEIRPAPEHPNIDRPAKTARHRRSKRHEPKVDKEVERRLKQRRRLRLACLVGLVVLGLSVLLAHRGQGGDGDDWARFDRRRLTVVSVALNGVVSIQPDGGEATPVRLLGIDLPRAGSPEAAAASRELAARSLGQEFMLRLEPLQTRTPDGALLAYLFASDADNLNLGLIRDGIVYADRRSPHSLRVQFEQAESDARKKRRGIWKSPGDGPMPDWRRQWLIDVTKKSRKAG